MRTTLVLATALVTTLPVLPAAAAARTPLAGASVHGPSVTAGRIASTTDGAVHGLLSLEARQLQGSEAVTVEGNAPANAQVTITLWATVSPDVPTIVVSRHAVVTDVTGRFGAVIPIASAYERGTLLTIVATSATGASASAHLITDAPNAGASVPFDNH